MKKAERELVRWAESIGLQMIEAGKDRRHDYIKFRNAAGMVVKRTMAQGAKANDPRDARNSRAELKRFARGQTHGLLIEENRA
jgi:hypothetical protein